MKISLNFSMTTYIKIWLVGFLFGLGALNFAAFGQNFCGTSELHQKRMQQDSAYRIQQFEFEKNIQQIIQNQKNAPANGAAKVKQIYTVPLVFHVLHLGEAIGTGTNVSTAQIQSAIAGLNDRFRGINGIGVDTEIDFCLATQDPSGCFTTGINRIDASGIPNYASKGISFNNTCGAVDEVVLKDLSKWSTYYYYNVWVVNLIDCSSLTISGFASPPSGTAYDGTVILASALNSVSTTLTHELGHGLGLWHTFEGDFGNTVCPSNTNCLTEGDLICDTPPHKQSDCGVSNPCASTGVWDNSKENYMSYCGQTNRFTADQKVRMRAAFGGFPRSLLLVSKACISSNFASIISKTDVSCEGVCDGTVSVIPTCPSTYTYSWNNGSSSNTQSGLCGGTYTLTLTDAANVSATIPIIIGEPPAITAIPNATGRSCNGTNDGSIQLQVSGGVPFSCGSNFTHEIGNGTVVSSNTQFPAPFGNSKWGAKHQLFFHQTEVQSGNFTSGKISSVALNVASLSGTTSYKNFEIKMKQIPNVGSLTVLQGGLQTVFNSQTVTISTGWNTFYFNNPFQYTGTGSIILQFCFNDSVSTFNSPVVSTTTPFKSVVYITKDSAGVCDLQPIVAPSAFRRPNVRFGVCNDSLNYAYLWSNGETGNSLSGLDTGLYVVIVRDANGCLTTATSTVNQNFSIANAGSDAFINLGNAAILGGNPSATGTPPFQYTWSPSIGLSSVNAANPFANPAVTTTFVLSVLDSSFCLDSDTVTVFVSTGTNVDELSLNDSIELFTDRNSDSFVLKGKALPNGEYSLKIYDAVGKKCFESNLNINNNQLNSRVNTAQLSKGFYFVSITSGNQTKVLKYWR
jgi:hypothetical protein